MIPYSGPDNPDILFLGGVASDEEQERGLFQDRPWALIKYFAGFLDPSVTYGMANTFSDALIWAKEIKERDYTRISPQIFELIREKNPRIIVALGSHAYKALFPGSDRSLTEAMGCPQKVGDRWCLCSLHPSNHISGRQDLTEEYTSLLSYASRILSGESIEALLEPDIRIVDQNNISDALAQVSRSELIALDTEEDTISDERSPEKKTFYQVGRKFLCLGIATDPLQPVWVFPAKYVPQLLPYLRHKTLLGHSVSHDILSMCWFFPGNEWLLEVPYECTFLLHASFDQGFTENSLEALATRYARVPKWKQRIWDMVREETARRSAARLIKTLGVATLGDMPLQDLAKYNGYDTHRTLLLWNELKRKQFPPVYESFLKPMVRTLNRIALRGIGFSEERRAAFAEAVEAKEQFLTETLQRIPDIQQVMAKQEISEFNPGSSAQLSVLMDIQDLETEKTPTGQWATGKGQIVSFVQKYPLWRRIHKIRQYRGLLSKFLYPLKYFVARDGNIHANFKAGKATQSEAAEGEGGGTSTGRIAVCVAEGTLVEMPRDLGEYPDGVPIEQVKVGDLVYSYNEAGDLLLRRVLGAGMTGVRGTVGIRWMASGHHGKKGVLYLTPEHLVRLLDGSWKPAGLLVPGDRVMALSRGLNNYGYARLWACRGREIREHVFIQHSLNPWMSKGVHVHHINHNRVDNRPENLEVLTPQDHVLRHPPSKVTRGKMSESGRKAHLEHPRLKPMFGSDNPRYRYFSRFTLLKALAKTQGRLEYAARSVGVAVKTLLVKCRELAIDNGFVRQRYGGDCKYISRGRLLRALQVKTTRGRTGLKNGHGLAVKVLHTNLYNVKRLCGYYGVGDRNHEVMEVFEGPVSKVYDLVVEETHCFIAGQLAVHNSDPGLHNLKDDPLVRSLFLTRPGYLAAILDVKGAEVITGAWLAGCKFLIKMFLEGKDPYIFLCGIVWGLKPEEVTPEIRDKAKIAFLAHMYGEMDTTFAKRTNTPLAEVQRFSKTFQELCPEIIALQHKIRNDVYNSRPIVTPWGRIRYFQTEEMNEAFNYPIQSTSSDIVQYKAMLLQGDAGPGHEDLKLDPEEAEIVLCVHDALWMAVRERGWQDTVRKVRDMMEDVGNLPFDNMPRAWKIDIKLGRDFGVAEKIKL